MTQWCTSAPDVGVELIVLPSGVVTAASALVAVAVGLVYVLLSSASVYSASRTAAQQDSNSNDSAAHFLHATLSIMAYYLLANFVICS